MLNYSRATFESKVLPYVLDENAIPGVPARLFSSQPLRLKWLDQHVVDVQVHQDGEWKTLSGLSLEDSGAVDDWRSFCNWWDLELRP